ncbi:MAG: cobalamin biosynthesis protein CobW [Rhodospirillaceae bacterium TMED63]|nr:cobalamin biosynthesis protein CobW [Rhodospirillaceae bacterium]RPF99741.1 MAG: cobalamin biosynthesis protein CobW [Rhodospirillaceae bacterium TMED63]
MAIAKKIPATVVTGFLGAGKTTMIRNLIERANGRKLALVINEFGDLAVDGELLKDCGNPNCTDDDIFELANGCICCTVADDFLPTIQKILDRNDPPDHIVIETSGLALPKPLVQAFGWPEVRTRVTVDGVVAVLDGPAVADGRFADDPDRVDEMRADDDELDHESPLHELYEDQLACADLVLLNKTDLMDDDAVEAVATEVGSRLRDRVRMVKTANGAIDPGVLLGIEAAAEDDLSARPSHHDAEDHHDHDDFESFEVAISEIGSPDALINRLQAAIAEHDILRVKGFVHVPGKNMRLIIQGVGARLQQHFDRPWEDGEPRETRLVVIGLSGLDKVAIAAALGGVAKG